MFRRLTSLLVVWFGLITIIVPTVTCAAEIGHGNCCPPERAPPCGECPEKREPRVPDPSVCITLPSQAVASAVVKQTSVEQDLSPDTLVFVPTVGPLNVATHSLAESARRPDYAAIHASSAVITYLVTRRLRL